MSTHDLYTKPLENVRSITIISKYWGELPNMWQSVDISVDTPNQSIWVSTGLIKSELGQVPIIVAMKYLIKIGLIKLNDSQMNHDDWLIDNGLVMHLKYMSVKVPRKSDLGCAKKWPIGVFKGEIPVRNS